MSRHVTLALLAAVLAPAALAAQRQSTVARADSLLQSGRVFAAETLYYKAAREQPRSPAARLALGRYLAARGALKVGAVLMEEARYFGGDAATIAAQLAPIYARLSDWRALASLPGSPLAYAERARAEFLREAPGEAIGPDTVVVAWQTATDDALGAVLLVIGADTLAAEIDASVQGIVLDTSWASRRTLRTFKSKYDADPRAFTAVIPAVGIGQLSLTNVPARFDGIGSAGVARVGLDVLARFTPTFDVTTQTITLRRQPVEPGALAGERHATLTYATGIWLVEPDGVRALDGESGRALLAGAPWTLDARRGEIIVAR